MKTYLGKQMWKFISLGKYLKYGSILGAYLWMDNIISEDNLDC